MATWDDRIIGFVGGGIIAEVFIRRLLDSGMVKPAQLVVSDPNGTTRERLRNSFGIRAVERNSDVAQGAAIIFLATPPPATLPALREIAPHLRADQLVLSMAAAVSLTLMERAIGHPVPVIRLVVNTPAWVGRGMTAFACGQAVTAAQRVAVAEMLQAFGRVVEVPEAQIATVAALAAVGPTYVFPVIGALAEAGVAHGLTLDLARTLACQVVGGSAALAADVPKTSRELTQMISLRTLDESAASHLFMQAVDAARAKLIAAAEKIETAEASL